MSGRKIIFLFVLSLLLFVLVKTPVAFVSQFVTLPKGVAYEGLQGSLWQGEIAQVSFNKIHLSQVKWQFEPTKLLTGDLAFQIRFGQPRELAMLSGKGVVAIGLAGKSVEQAVVRVPANQAKPFLPIPMGDIAGRVIANIDEYQFGEPICQVVQGDIGWHKAGIDIGGPIEFGSIEAQLNCQDGKLLANFDGENRLGLDGSATIESAKKFGFNGYLKPSSDLPAVVHQGIGMMTKMDSQGRYKISL